MQKIVIIGGDSYIATGLDEKLKGYEVKYLFFNNWKEHISSLKNADCIINFSICPSFSTQDMDLNDILDIQIAEVIKDLNVRYIFMSSRKVYGSSDECKSYKETDPINGIDFYAKNKIKTEAALTKILSDKLTVLRISNILGEPVSRVGYKTFIGWICESFLNTGELVVTQNSNSRKDFITKDFLQDAIVTVLLSKTSGVINISSGFATSVGDILKGYVGEEHIKFNGEQIPPTDQFILDNSKLKKILPNSITRDDINRYLKKCYKQLIIMKQSNCQKTKS